MSRESHKRSVMTARDYKRASSKRSKHSTNSTANPPSTILSPSSSSTVSDLSTTTTHSLVNSDTLSHIDPTKYYIFSSSEGIDLSTFRLPLIAQHQPRLNISAIVTKSLHYKFIELVNVSNTTSTPDISKKKHRSRKSSHSNRFLSSLRSKSNDFSANQTKISSFLTPLNNSLASSTFNRLNITAILHNKSRLVVEDFIQLKPGAEVAILIPKLSSSQTPSIRSFMRTIGNANLIQFGPNKHATKYHLFHANVKSNNQLLPITTHSLSVSDVISAFNPKRDNGYAVTFVLDSNLQNRNNSSKLSSNTIQIKWIEILNGRAMGIQVWSKLDNNRDFTTNLEQYIKPSSREEEVISILSFIYDEIASDAIATANLMARYHMLMHNQKKMLLQKALKEKNNSNLTQVINIDSDTYSRVNEQIEQVFELAMNKCYTDFSEISTPILSRKEISDLVTLYKTQLTNHYLANKQMLGFDKKECLKKNDHLTISGYYDRILFYHYLSSSRIKFNHNFSIWSLINTGSIYGHGEGRRRSQTSSFFGLGCTMNTFMKKTKSLRENSNSNIHLRIRDEDKVICCVDNNQKGNPLKYQRY